jgi:hypothetical protein
LGAWPGKTAFGGRSRGLPDCHNVTGDAGVRWLVTLTTLTDLDVTRVFPAKHMARKLRDALPGGEGALRAALREFMRPMLSPALVALNRDAFVIDEPDTTVDLGAYRAASDLDDLLLEDDHSAEAALARGVGRRHSTITAAGADRSDIVRRRRPGCPVTEDRSLRRALLCARRRRPADDRDLRPAQRESGSATESRQVWAGPLCVHARLHAVDRARVRARRWQLGWARL